MPVGSRPRGPGSRRGASDKRGESPRRLNPDAERFVRWTGLANGGEGMTSVGVPESAPPRRVQGAMAQLEHKQLVASQQQTLATPRRRYSVGARALFTMLDAVYGKPRTLSKFKVRELIARVPYQACEQVGNIAIT